MRVGGRADVDEIDSSDKRVQVAAGGDVVFFAKFERAGGPLRDGAGDFDLDAVGAAEAFEVESTGHAGADDSDAQWMEVVSGHGHS
jgi:hypothetical protein